MKATSEVVDAFGDRAEVCLLQFRSFGRAAFSGRIATVRCHEDNVLLRDCVSDLGDRRVLVVDGGGSYRSALLGYELAKLALDNGWAGIVIHGCVRDSLGLKSLDIGVKALGTNPCRPRKDGAGEVGVPLNFGSATFEPGALLYADEDGVVVVSE